MPNYLNYKAITVRVFPDWLTEVDDSWTLFLDRDGTINKRIMDGYVTEVSQFEFLPDVLDAIAALTQWFNRLIIVTNQQGVGKELMTLEDLNAIHDHMMLVITEHGGQIDQILSCTHLADSLNNCRKPSPSMALQAEGMFPDIKFEKSIMIGDTPSDMQFGHNCGMKSVYCGDPKHLDGTRPDMTVSSVWDFMQVFQEAMFAE